MRMIIVKNWAKEVKCMLERHGFGYIWLEQKIDNWSSGPDKLAAFKNVAN